MLRRYRINSVKLCETGLRAYGSYTWYAPPKDKMPDDFALVICDGPPGTTRGGRYGLLPIMKPHLKSGCLVLLDDAGRAGERAIIARWANELGTDFRIEGTEEPFGIIYVPN